MRKPQGSRKAEPCEVVCTLVHEALRALSDDQDQWRGSFSAWYDAECDFSWDSSSVLKYLQALDRVQLLKHRVPSPRFKGDRRQVWWINPTKKPVTAVDIKKILLFRQAQAEREREIKRKENKYATDATGHKLPEHTSGGTVTTRVDPSIVRVDDGLIPGKKVVVVTPQVDEHARLVAAREQCEEVMVERDRLQVELDAAVEQIGILSAATASPTSDRVATLEAELIEAREVISALLENGELARMIRATRKLGGS